MHGISVWGETVVLLLIFLNQAYDLTKFFGGDLLLFGKERDQLLVGVVEVALHHSRQEIALVG